MRLKNRFRIVATSTYLLPMATDPVLHSLDNFTRGFVTTLFIRCTCSKVYWHAIDVKMYSQLPFERNCQQKCCWKMKPISQNSLQKVIGHRLFGHLVSSGTPVVFVAVHDEWLQQILQVTTPHRVTTFYNIRCNICRPRFPYVAQSGFI